MRGSLPKDKGPGGHIGSGGESGIWELYMHDQHACV